MGFFFDLVGHGYYIRTTQFSVRCSGPFSGIWTLSQFLFRMERKTQQNSAVC
jgi:hypothetical protein